jgi:hypothetical protein
MPLSEHEELLLSQMEHALAQSDPIFALRMSESISRRRRRRRLRFGALLIAVGLMLTLFGVSHNTLWPGALGFLIMLFGADRMATGRQPLW